jgi:hypothetical protein
MLADPETLKADLRLQPAYRDEKLLPDSKNFIFNTKAACEHYQNDYTHIDANYCIGDEIDACTTYENYRIGSKEQINDAHMIELYAALAALDFWNTRKNTHEKFYKIRVHNPNSKDVYDIGLSDLPMVNGQPHRKQWEKFALLCNYWDEIHAYLVTVDKQNILDCLAWLRRSGIRQDAAVSAMTSIGKIQSFCLRYKNWIKQNHTNKARLAIFQEDLRLDELLVDNPNAYERFQLYQLDRVFYKAARDNTDPVDSLITVLNNGLDAFLGGGDAPLSLT